MRKTPMNYPKIPLPTYTALDFARAKRLQGHEASENTKSDSSEQSLQNNTARNTKDENRVKITSKYIPALTAYNSNTLGLGESKYLKFTQPEHKNLREMRRLRLRLVPVKHLADVDHLKLPVIPRDKATVQSHEPLRTKKNCATEMLGVRFKTDAHKR